MREGTVGISAQIPASLYNRLENHKDTQGMTTRGICIKALEMYLNAVEKQAAQSDEERN